MKNFFFLVLLATITTAASAQKPPIVDSNVTLVGLPVLRSYVAPDVVHRAKKKYGRSLYCIEKTLAANCENSYLVGLIRNGKLSMEWMCDDAKMVLHIDETIFSTAKGCHLEVSVATAAYKRHF